LHAMQARGKMAAEVGEMKETSGRISGFWIVLLVVAGILVLGDLNSRMAQARRLEREAEMVGTEVAAMATERVRLMTQVAEATSEAHVAEWAHRDAKLVREGETLVIPLPPPGATPLPTPAPAVRLAEPSPWQVWWALLFGK